MTDWMNYLIRQDFTELGEILQEIPMGPLSEADQRLMAQILSECGPAQDEDKWNMDEYGTEFSLNGAEVIYNDLNKNLLPTFSMFDRALGLKFPARSVGPVGVIYLCWYNPPAVADEE